MRNRTKFRHFLPKRGRRWQRIDVFRDRFYENGPSPAARAPSQRAPTTNWPAGLEHHQSAPAPICRHAIRGFHGGPAICIGTDMVELRKVPQRVNRHFHHPSRGFGGKPLLQTNGLLERVSAFGRFWGYQILPNFTNFYQKCVAKGVRRGSKRQLTGGFSRAIYLKRLKSDGSCQAIIGWWSPCMARSSRRQRQESAEIINSSVKRRMAQASSTLIWLRWEIAAPPRANNSVGAGFPDASNIDASLLGRDILSQEREKRR